MFNKLNHILILTFLYGHPLDKTFVKLRINSNTGDNKYD